MITNIELKYSVGALLYCPALNNKIAKNIAAEEFGNKYSLALCLEDTIAPDMVEQAEQQVRETLKQIYQVKQSVSATYIPKLFIRVREPQQMKRVFEAVADYQEILTGFIFPKYTLSNAKQYNEQLLEINNKTSTHTIYMMPIL